MNTPKYYLVWFQSISFKATVFVFILYHKIKEQTEANTQAPQTCMRSILKSL